MSVLSTFLPFGGGNYTHQVSGDNDKTCAHFKRCIKCSFWFLMKPYFSCWTIRSGRNSYTQCGLPLSSAGWSYSGKPQVQPRWEMWSGWKGWGGHIERKWNRVNEAESLTLEVHFCFYFLILLPILITVSQPFSTWSPWN